ncbi:RNB domain-containing ribonuclease [Aestuariimicrobium kwangyangense]|uniref:RNB domain-containing ribonuclease n=1 Tax=Aestuariimicrobium kwangyangense TaxID=396389 RepID=UPI0003B3EE15|nr:RNB domain-containing ribonuclease [Aestuariimicrobium kwangyangense]
MPVRHLRADEGFPAAIKTGFDRLCDEIGAPLEFPAEVVAEAERVASAGYDSSRTYDDLTDVPFVTIDPEGSMDLDQAMYIEKAKQGYTVLYAIADVAAWVAPGGPIDAEAHRRGQTLYAPNRRFPLHPPVLSEAAASLLADGRPRPAIVWRLDLDAHGQVTATAVTRALVVSRERLDYPTEQAKLDNGQAGPVMQLLREVGDLRQQLEVERGGVSLNLPEQVVDTSQSGGWRLTHRSSLPNENWNAQISLMTGMAAAQVMLEAGVGILRTLPPPDREVVRQLRAVAHTLKLPWPESMSYAEFVGALDVTNPVAQAMMMSCVRLFRGAGYTVIKDGLAADQLVHGALAANYAHTTAPLRRLVDRYVLEVCVALSAGQPVPEWALAALPSLPDEMAESDRRAKAFERGITDLVEALVLSDKVGQVFTGVVIQVDDKREDQGIVSIVEPAIEARVSGDLELGDEARVRLVKADPVEGKVGFEVA